MTTLYVDNIAPNLQSKISAPNLQPLAGSVIQVVQAFKYNETSTSSTSFVDTGLSKSITPSSSSSKILVSFDFPARSNNMGVSFNVQFSTDGGSTYNTITIGGPQGWGHAVGYITGGSTANWSHITKSYLHSPSTSNTITYKVQYKAIGSGTNCIICDSGDAALLTLMEIAG